MTNSMQAWEIKQAARRTKAAELHAEFPDLLPASSGSSSLVVAAKNIRIELKKAFPGVKFSVRSRGFAGGNAIDVRWIDGPASAKVDPIIQKYKAGSFDGMTDCYNYSHSAWTDAFGDAKYIHCERSHSPAFIGRAIEIAKEKFGDAEAPTVEQFKNGEAWRTSPMSNYNGLPHWSWQSIIHRTMSEIDA
jgi:hypothetical protein